MRVLRKSEKEAGTNFIFIVSIKKHDWMIQKNLFTQMNKDSTISFM